MSPLLQNPAFHHIEVPCPDLDLAERFYSRVLGAFVYMRRDERRVRGVPASGSIADAQSHGFRIDGSYMRVGGFRIGFLKGEANHRQSEVDHVAFSIDNEDLEALGAAIEEEGGVVVDRSEDRLLARDPFGLTLELWPRPVLERMGLLE